MDREKADQTPARTNKQDDQDTNEEQTVSRRTIRNARHSNMRLETNQQDTEFNDEYTTDNTGYSGTQRKQSRNYNQEQTNTVAVNTSVRG